LRRRLACASFSLSFFPYEEEIEGAKNIFFCLPQKTKTKNKKIKLTQVETNSPRLKQIDLGWNKLT